MVSPFVKGLMCATLLQLGASSSIALARGLIHQSSVASLLWHIPGILALVLALLLFTRSSVAARTAFAFLLFSALVHIGVPIWIRSRTPCPLRQRRRASSSDFCMPFHASLLSLPLATASNIHPKTIKTSKRSVASPCSFPFPRTMSDITQVSTRARLTRRWRSTAGRCVVSV